MHKQTNYQSSEVDEVLCEVDVFLSKSLADNLYLFHYPLKPFTDSPDEVECLSAKIKPKQQKLELEFSLDTDVDNYDRSRGEQFAINVDGLNSSEEPHFKSAMMDKVVLTATAVQDDLSVNNYAIGVIRKGELHITPLHSALELRQNFGYMDKMDGLNKKTNASEETAEEDEEEAVAVTVRFEGPNAERDKQMREKSYQYLQQKNASEPWINVNYHQFDSPKSKVEYSNLLCGQMCNDTPCTGSTSEEYLKTLIPESFRRIGGSSNKENSVPGDQPLSDQIKQLLISSHVLKFSTIVEQLPSDVDIISVERLVQQIAVLVQGCWIVKSELLHAEDSVSPLSGISGKFLINARDYVIWLFTKSRVIARRDVLSAIYIPDQELTNMLNQLAINTDKGWELKYPYDSDFIENHRSTEQSQNIKWDLRYKKLVKELNLGQSQKLPCPVLPRKQKRLSRSSLSEDGEESGTDTSSSKDTKVKRVYSPKKRMNTSPVKHSSKSPKPFPIATLNVSPTVLETSLSDEIKTQLKDIIEDSIQTQFVMTLSSLKELISESHLSSLCNRSDIEQIIEEILLSCDCQKLKNKWPQNTTPEPIFAFWKFGNKFDSYRNILLELFSTTARIRTNIFMKKVEDELREIISENDSRQIFEEYCVYKSGFYYLKGTISPDS